VLTGFVKDRYFVQTEEYSSFFDAEDNLKMSVFEDALAKVDPKKSPGSPMVYLCPNNAALQKHLFEIFALTDKRLKAMEEIGSQVWEKSLYTDTVEHAHVAKYLVECGATDPVLLGIKGEPRAVNNGVKKQPRLISQVSVLTNIVARIIHGNHLLEEQTHTNLPTATALDLTTPARTDEIFQEFKENSRKKPLMTNDVQGYEYSVTEDDRWNTCFKEAMCMGLMDFNWNVVPGKERHLYALIGYYFCLIHKVVQLQTGELYVVKPGQMSSGELGTYSGNSFARAFTADLVSRKITQLPVEYIKTGGDDSVESQDGSCQQYVDAYLLYGKVITEAELHRDEFTFCSTRFRAEGSYQENIRKSVYAILLRKCFDEQARLAFEMCFRNHPEYEKYLAVVSRWAM